MCLRRNREAISATNDGLVVLNSQFLSQARRERQNWRRYRMDLTQFLEERRFTTKMGFLEAPSHMARLSSHAC
jgi:hypothetical protein